MTASLSITFVNKCKSSCTLNYDPYLAFLYWWIQSVFAGAGRVLCVGWGGTRWFHGRQSPCQQPQLHYYYFFGPPTHSAFHQQIVSGQRWLLCAPKTSEWHAPAGILGTSRCGELQEGCHHGWHSTGLQVARWPSLIVFTCCQWHIHISNSIYKHGQCRNVGVRYSTLLGLQSLIGCSMQMWKRKVWNNSHFIPVSDILNSKHYWYCLWMLWPPALGQTA